MISFVSQAFVGRVITISVDTDAKVVAAATAAAAAMGAPQQRLRVQFEYG